VSAPAEYVELDASYGKVRAVFMPNPRLDRALPTLLFFHGNGQLVERVLADLAAWRGIGLNLMLVEYPGYGGADGAPSLISIDEAGKLAFDWLTLHPRVAAARIVSVGLSVGGGPATQLSAKRPVAALVLLSTFSAVAEFARQRYLPAWLVRDPFDNVARLRTFDGPALIVHGTRDALIPYTHATTLADANPRAELLGLACGHNDCGYFEPGFAHTLADFLRKADILRDWELRPDPAASSP
jgi:fermentation-respiration switch protein FrsA (DUF1100 family)